MTEFIENITIARYDTYFELFHGHTFSTKLDMIWMCPVPLIDKSSKAHEQKNSVFVYYLFESFSEFLVIKKI